MASAVVAVGECMLELSQARAGPCLGEGWRLGFGGDTFNTALYLHRLGVPVAYLTALGTDPCSMELMRAWADEGLDVSLVLSDATRQPGLYAIRTDVRGERSFQYWRSQSAARALFRLPGIEAALATARRAELLFLSGITLSLYETGERARLQEVARAVRAAGGAVAFDPNYRPAGWPDEDAARDALALMAAHTSIALPTFEDEQRLWGDRTPGDTADRWLQQGAREVVVKRGAAGCLVASGRTRIGVAAEAVDRVVDTTGAGDAFNAGYLAARRRGESADTAARAGHRLAAQVIQHAGALLPRGIVRPPEGRAPDTPG